ncbi:hypothetical protein C4901_09830 [Acidiferrobacter sp. SPIII_3]|jgi:hypothetical protein|nr:hypothetical protein C4901_09830 [Acidiferrobacter sp. SPIII_3]
MDHHASGNAGFYEAAIVRRRKTDFRARRHTKDMSAAHPPLIMIANALRVADPTCTTGNEGTW